MFEHIHDPGARVRALCDYGGQVEVDSAVPPRRYFRSGNEMLRMASVYVDENKLEQAFILYTKFITLFLEKLPKHPEYKTSTLKEKSANKQKLKDVFPKAEAIKDKLKKRYEITEKKRQEDVERLRQEQLRQQEEEEKIREQKQLDKIGRELDDKEQMRQEYGNRMIQEQEEQYRQLQELERQKLKDQEQGNTTSSVENEAGGIISGMADIAVQNYDGVRPPPPSYGAVITDQNSYPSVPTVPSRDLKPAPSAPPLITSDTNLSQVPDVDRSSKPVHHFTSVGDTSNLYGLHTVHVPSELMIKFLNIAQSNTSNNLETGGFLFGKLSNDVFHITHLIIPKQKSSSDSFTELSNEDALWDIQEKHDIVQLGWIHTHPSQTAFLSSVDQHVQASFQIMLPESIAIVCAPKHNETGIFYLTPDYGLDFVRNCRGTGFHPHPSSPTIFETCSHAILNPNGKISVIDLRT